MREETEKRTRPAFVDESPIMAGAFASFMGWAWEQDELHAAFCEATKRPRLARDPLEALIDDACGVTTEGYAADFIEWLIVNHWGAAE